MNAIGSAELKFAADHARGGKLNCGIALSQIASCIIIGNPTNRYHYTASRMISD